MCKQSCLLSLGNTCRGVSSPLEIEKREKYANPFITNDRKQLSENMHQWLSDGVSFIAK